MQRYFGSVIDGHVLLSEDDAFHLLKVNRSKVHEKIEVVSDGMTFLCEIIGLKPLNIVVIEKINEVRELPCDIILACALLKGDKLDYVLQKATELGVSEIVLLYSKRVIVKKDNYSNAHKLERFHRILKEASEQSHRTKIPLLYRTLDINELDQIKADIKLIAYEEVAGSTKSFTSQINKAKKGDKIVIVIGPEGGFEESEVKTAMDFGYTPISLGRRILRAETASIYSLSVIASMLER